MELKYKFENLEQAKTAIEKWFKDCGCDGPDTDGKQKQKIFEEIDELEAEIKSGNIENQKSEAGDVFVTLVGKELKENRALNIYFTDYTIKDVYYNLEAIKEQVELGIYCMAAEYLNDICINLNIDLLECATITYNKIQGRLERGELKVVNGTITKVISMNVEKLKEKIKFENHFLRDTENLVNDFLKKIFKEEYDVVIAAREIIFKCDNFKFEIYSVQDEFPSFLIEHIKEIYIDYNLHEDMNFEIKILKNGGVYVFSKSNDLSRCIMSPYYDDFILKIRSYYFY